MNGRDQIHLHKDNMATSLCFGYWAECPESCSLYTPEKNQKKCFVWKVCYKDWFDSGGRLGLFDLMHPEKL